MNKTRKTGLAMAACLIAGMRLAFAADGQGQKKIEKLLGDCGLSLNQTQPPKEEKGVPVASPAQDQSKEDYFSNFPKGPLGVSGKKKLCGIELLHIDKAQGLLYMRYVTNPASLYVVGHCEKGKILVLKCAGNQCVGDKDKSVRLLPDRLIMDGRLYEPHPPREGGYDSDSPSSIYDGEDPSGGWG